MVKLLNLQTVMKIINILKNHKKKSILVGFIMTVLFIYKSKNKIFKNFLNYSFNKLIVIFMNKMQKRS